MLSLFSSFDLFFFCTPYASLFIMLFSCLNYCYKLTYQKSLVKVGVSFLHNISLSATENQSCLALVIWVAVFLSAFLANYYSVWGYVYSITAHPGYVICAGATFWFMFNIRFFFYRWKAGLLHFIPKGCPLVLAPFLFTIEVVSLCIRPITLSIRLCANILAGHLLMILLSKMALLGSPAFMVYLLLNVVEFFVSFIQAYIFVTLITLYYSETC